MYKSRKQRQFATNQSKTFLEIHIGFPCSKLYNVSTTIVVTCIAEKQLILLVLETRISPKHKLYVAIR